MGRNEGGWCKYKGDMALILKAKQENHYHDKDQEPTLYTALTDILKQFSTDKILLQPWHPYWIQKSELLNQFVSIFAHKDTYLSSSMLLSDHVALVVIMDSVGYAQGLSKVFQRNRMFTPSVNFGLPQALGFPLRIQPVPQKH